MLYAIPFVKCKTRLILCRTISFAIYYFFVTVNDQETQLNPFLRLMGMPKIVYTEFDIDDDGDDGDVENKNKN
jgi:hypothetical protein